MLYLETSNFQLREFWKKELDVVCEFEIDKLGGDDILILDIDSFDSVQDILEFKDIFNNNLKIIALTNEPKLAHGTYLIKNEFKSYIGKKTLISIIKQVLSTVSKGNVWLYPQLMTYIIQNLDISKISKREKKEVLLSKLSKKEKEVALFVSEGFPNRKIAEKMNVQTITIKKHVGVIFLKLGFKDRVALAIALK